MTDQQCPVETTDRLRIQPHATLPPRQLKVMTIANKKSTVIPERHEVLCGEVFNEVYVEMIVATAHQQSKEFEA